MTQSPKQELATGHGAIRAVDVAQDYGSGPVLGGITLTINPGELVAIMGPSGSGKSTLLHCLSGIITPTSGEVHLSGHKISSLPDAARSEVRLKELGFIFQDGQLIPELTALENVGLPLRMAGMSRGEASTVARSALQRMGLADFAERRPGELSGGQEQRVAIARAVAGEPAVIFADEPTGALDQTTGHEVMQVLTALLRRQGGTLVMVTHDINVARWCDRLIEIRDGIVHNDSRQGTEGSRS